MAPIARLPAAKSGSSVAQSGVSTIAAMVEQIGHASAALVTLDTALSGLAGVAVRPRPAGVLLILCLGSLLLHRRCLGFADFHPIGIGVFGHLSKLPEICRGFLRLICGLRRLSCAVKAAQLVGRRHQRSLIFS